MKPELRWAKINGEWTIISIFQDKNEYYMIGDESSRSLKYVEEFGDLIEVPKKYIPVYIGW